MPETPAASAEFASCASTSEALNAGASFLSLTLIGLLHPPMWPLVFPMLGVAGWLWVRARRIRGRPYLLVRDGRLTIQAGRHEPRQVDLRELVGVRRGWNSTTLELGGGARVVIHHTWFASTNEADRFREFVEEIHGGKTV